MDKIRFIYLGLSLFLLNFSCSCQAQIPLNLWAIKEKSIITIDKLYDLGKDTLFVPKDVTFHFKKGGGIYNGSIIGNNTQIIGFKHNIFNNITFSGSWKVENISTDMFSDLSEINSIKSVFALTSSEIYNVLTVMPGDYKVAADSCNIKVLKIPSNTEVIMNGTVSLEPNNLGKYYIFYLEGRKIKLHGNGSIIGDKYTHLDNKWEWGMGISIHNSNDIEVSDITVKNCWGDCIYIDDNSKNIHINNCILDNGRRQGISVISGDNILIENCLILNVKGTAPQYGIDIEPDKDKRIGKVVVKNVHVKNCVGGITAYGCAKNAHIDNILLYDCYVEGCQDNTPPYAFKGVNRIEMDNCHFDKGKIWFYEKIGKKIVK